MDLFDIALPKELDFTVPGRFLESKEPDKTTFNPGTNSYITEASIYGLNWAALFCLSMVLTKGFVFSEEVLKKNYFALKDSKGVPQPFRTWAEGVRAGTQTVAALVGVALQGDVVWPGTLQVAAGNPPGAGPKDSEACKLAVDKYYGQGTWEQAEALYKELLDFAQGAGNPHLPGPIVIGPPVPPVKGPISAPTEPPSVPDKPGARSWQITLAKWLGSLSTLFFIVKLFLPGWIDQLVDLGLKIVDLLVHY